MAEASATNYDQVPYTNYVFSFTHPARLGVLPALLGMRPADPAHCRVLELGCAAGANLIPMAYELPESEFVGIDLSRRQVEQGRRGVAALGLKNIDLRPGSILEVDADFGRFDYIICHGVYSWVPAEVREGILAVCKANLAADGVAYVSYNTYPGWHLRTPVREMMAYHVGRITDPGERVRQARALLKFLVDVVGTGDAVYGGLLRREADVLAQHSDAYVYHDLMEPVNEPVYFHQFAEAAAARGLQYVGEAEPTPMAQPLSPEASATLERLAGSVVQLEQYLDFVRNRTFRRTLLCHDGVRLRYPLQSEAVSTLYLSSLVNPVAGGTQPGAAPSEEFRGPQGSVWTDYPALRAALHSLSEAAPAALSFEALWQRVRAAVPHLGDDGRKELTDALLQCYFSRMVELVLAPPRLAVEGGERPCASALARLQAAASPTLCNLRHGAVTLDSFDRVVLQQLDGTRDGPALAEALARLAADGTFKVEHGGSAVRDPAVLRDVMRQALGPALERLGRSALLLPADES
jgi:methyltransferase-like protein